MKRLLVFAFAVFVACSQTTREFKGAASGDEVETLLKKYVTLSGRVDYLSFKNNKDDVAKLDGYLARITSRSPDSHPAQFATVSAQISYWTNLYNLLVLREVIRNWPIESVQEVKIGAVSYLVPGKGFFDKTTFTVGGKTISLDDIEHNIIRVRYQDARIHFVLNCGANSCPPLPRKLFSPATFDSQVQEATVAFIHDRSNVRIEPNNNVIRVSKLFDWYAKDFKNHAKRHYGSDERSSIVDFLLIFAKPQLKAELVAARKSGYELTHFSYDWEVNKGRVPPDEVVRSRSRKPMKAISFALHDGTTWTPAATKGKVVVLDFWATYCAPCKELLPQLSKMRATYEKQGLEVIAISLDDDKQYALEFAQKLQLALPLAFDVEQTALEAGIGVKKLPAEIILDRKGRVVAVENGDIDAAKLEALVKKLLAER